MNPSLLIDRDEIYLSFEPVIYPLLFRIKITSRRLCHFMGLSLVLIILSSHHPYDLIKVFIARLYFSQIGIPFQEELIKAS